MVVVLFDTETEGRPTKKQKSCASAKLKAEEGVVLDGIVLLLAKSKADLEDYTNNSHLLILVAFDEAARCSTKKQEELNNHDKILAVRRACNSYIWTANPMSRQELLQKRGSVLGIQ